MEKGKWLRELIEIDRGYAFKVNIIKVGKLCECKSNKVHINKKCIVHSYHILKQVNVFGIISFT